MHSFRSKALAACLFLFTSASMAFESCIPPQCATPVALDWNDGFDGSNPMMLMAMALTIPCAWLIVWGFFMLIGFRPNKRVPILYSQNPQAVAHWKENQRLQAKEWNDIYSKPETAYAARKMGGIMLASGVGLSILLCLSDKPASATPSLDGTVARVMQFNGTGMVESDAFVLDKERKVCKLGSSPCQEWGTWIATGDALILWPKSHKGKASADFPRMVSDESKARYWAKPDKNGKLSMAIFLDKPAATPKEPAFKAIKGRTFD